MGGGAGERLAGWLRGPCEPSDVAVTTRRQGLLLHRRRRAFGGKISVVRPGGKPPAYFGPGAGPGPIHHYVFEFYALDTKLDLPANTTREDLLKAMDGHVIGKAAWFGRFHGPAAK